MPRNGSGTFTPPPSNPVSPGTEIESTWANETIADMSLALTQSIAIDGQTIPTANLPMGAFRHLNVADPTLRNQYASLGMVQDGTHQRIQNITGVDNLTGTLVGGATAYVAGALVSFYAPANNTGPMTLSYNGIGAKSLVSSEGQSLAGGEVKAGDFLLATYTGTVFSLLSSVTSAIPPEVYAIRTTGQQRPEDGDYPSLTVASGTSINVPAGTAWIIPPGADSANDPVEVTWAQQTVNLTYLTTSFTTTIAVDVNGVIQQIAGRALGASLRSLAVLGAVSHVTGVVSSVTTRPAIFGGDLYRGTDTASILTNYLISGGLVSANSVSPLQLDISAGAISMPGGTPNTPDSPNVYSIAQQSNISFRTLAGQNTVGGSLILNAPVTQYDPNGSGVVTTIPNNGDATIHRLYFLYGQYIWAFGQALYTSVENAASLIEVDRTKYKPSLFLSDATLVAEIIAIKNATSLLNIAQGAIVAPGGINFSIGSAGGISEAPINGTPYGRQDAGWVSVLGATAPAMLNSASITGPAPDFNLVMSPYGAGTISQDFMANTFKWASFEVVNPDDKMYIRSYNPVNGNLRFSTIFDLATGAWTFPGAVNATTFVGAHSGNGSALTDVNHANLTNLTAGDPHTQYLTQARGDARYPLRDSNFTQFAVVSALPGVPVSNTIYFVTA